MKKDKVIKEETPAKKHWQAFESFVLEYLKDKYGITDKTFARITPPSGDGGYDGIIYTSVSFSEKEIKEILFEAKLRSALGNALPMNDFSKALIIAVNRFAHGIYIATNITFSPETLHQLELFQSRIGISINVINGKELFNWYINFPKNNYLDFDKDFISFLKQSSEKISEVASLPAYEQENNTKYVQDLFRKRENEKIKDVIKNINHGVVLVKGIRGSGKSCLCNFLKNDLQKTNYQIAQIDMKEAETSREIFLRLLEIIWGISPEVIIGCSEDEFKEIWGEIGKQRLDDKKIQCLHQIFAKDIEEYKGHWDMYQYDLIYIVDLLFRHYTGINCCCIHIHNLEMGYYETCSFIMKIITRLQKHKIVFLVELQDDYAGNLHIKKEQWTEISQRFLDSDYVIKEYKIELLSANERAEYIKYKVPGLKVEQLLELSDCLPSNPIILNATLEILAPRLSSQYMLSSEFQNELEYFNRNCESAIILQMIRSKICFGGFERLALPFAMLTLLNGKCSIANFQQILEYDKELLIEHFNNTGLCNIRDNVVLLKHEFYLNSLQHFDEYITKSALEKLARKMLENIDCFYEDAMQKKLLHIKLLTFTDEKRHIIKMSVEIGKVLLKQGDLNQALEIYRIGYDALKKFSTKKAIEDILFELIILQNIIYIVENTSNNVTDIDTYLHILKDTIKTSKRLLKNHAVYQEARLNEMIYEMKRFHKLSEHLKCLKYAYRAKRYARKVNAYKKFPSTFEQVLWLKALSIKHVSGIQACLQSFKSETNRNPNLPLLTYSYNTHKAAVISGEKPQKALQYFKINEKYYALLPMSEQLHNRVNIANIYFFLKKYKDAFTLSDAIITDALTYDIKIELGRIYNLIGNYYYIGDSLEQGEHCYKKAINIFEDINHQIHLWPPLVNLATLYIECENYECAYHSLRKVTHILIYRSNELKDSAGKTINNSPKIYIGAIIVLHLLLSISDQSKEAHELYQELYSKINKYMPNNIEKIITSPEVFLDFFQNSVYEHNNKIILKL